MPRRRRQITADERALWAWAVRETRPLPGRVAEPPPPPPPAAPAPLATLKADHAPPPPRPARTAPGRLESLDRREASRLKQGALDIEARLDLHGLTQIEAHHALDAFIDRNWAGGRRYLLVITGKGTAGEHGSGGVLKRALPFWLAASRHRGRVLALAEAAPRHGGGGAYYLRLRRPR